VFRYHIPLWIYAPGHVAPGRVDRLMAQVDIGPTLLGLLGMDYRSAFYGVDLFALEPGRERAFIGNYQRLGYLRAGTLVELAPHRALDDVRPDYSRDASQAPLAPHPALDAEAIAYYQTASWRFAHGAMAAAAVDAPVPAGALVAARASR
jgi:arylsulfatase A-like enzyme